MAEGTTREKQAVRVVTESAPLDEMADGTGQIRPHWRGLLGAMFSLGRDTMADRARVLARAFAEEGVTTILPGEQAVNWRCDPIPLLISAQEFAALEAGLGQRAVLLEAILQDLYGPCDLLAEGALPAQLVFDNPGFLRASRTDGCNPRDRFLRLYAADLLRGSDGVWRVLADRTDQASGLAYALENRRVLSRVMPELFQAQKIQQFRPFLDECSDMLQALVPNEGAGVALLTSGHGDPMWFEHVLLARELSIGLVEGGDLTIRGGNVFLKTLRGLQQIGVLFRRQAANRVDPLELTSGTGTPGLLDAVRNGTVRVVNGLGSSVIEAPAIAAFLPALARRLLGEDLQVPSQATLWLGEGAVIRTVLRDLDGWLIRPATNGAAAPILPSHLSVAQRAELVAQISADPDKYAASMGLQPSVAPCVEPDGRLEPKPIALRMFLAFDGSRWRALPGGLARALSEEDALAGRLPLTAVSKDVWVLADGSDMIHGTHGLAAPLVRVRRTPGDLPSRVADNFFWLGRYLERLEESARLQRAMITRLLRPSPTPRELSEIELLIASLATAGMLDREEAGVLGTSTLAPAVLRPFRANGAMRDLLDKVSRQVGQLRDRITGEMHAVLTRSLRELGDAMRNLPRDLDPRSLESASHLTTGVLLFAATVSGLAAENMVRGGGRLFLDFGRRMERAQAILSELGQVLDQPNAVSQPGRVEVALRLALELRDSVITYRSRYLAVLQPVPALDLILTDPSNPRGLMFQLETIRELLREIVEEGDSLRTAMDGPLSEADAIIRDVGRAPDQMAAAARLPPRLRALEETIAAVSDRVSRRYFTLLPVARSLGVDDAHLRGAA